MEQSIINEKMKELAKMISFEFDDIKWLARAMCVKKNSEGEYQNDVLATIGVLWYNTRY